MTPVLVWAMAAGRLHMMHIMACFYGRPDCGVGDSLEERKLIFKSPFRVHDFSPRPLTALTSSSPSLVDSILSVIFVLVQTGLLVYCIDTSPQLRVFSAHAFQFF